MPYATASDLGLDSGELGSDGNQRVALAAESGQVGAQRSHIRARVRAGSAPRALLGPKAVQRASTRTFVRNSTQ